MDKRLKKLADEARALVMVDQETTDLFGGVPFSKSLMREMRNYEKFLEEGLPGRSRVALGWCTFDDRENVIGYTACTVMQDASLTQYEREHISKLSAPLNYVQLKRIVVHPDYRGTHVAHDLMRARLEIADEFDKEVVVDVKQKNGRVIGFLGKYDITPRFEWFTPQDTPMWRMGN